MPERWFGPRGLRLHATMVVLVAGCAVAAWWQVTRAFAGNSLSYLYAVEWPMLAVIAIVAWWKLVHTDPETVGARAMARQRAALEAEGQRDIGAPPPRRMEEEDPELAAYNDRLAALSERPPQTWRQR